jgi:hypothetical protein
MENHITLKEFYNRCPIRLDSPANITLCGGILWRGYVSIDNDLDICIWGVERRPIIIEQLQKLTSVRIVPAYHEPFIIGATAPLYVNGVKVAECPKCPTEYPITLKEKVYRLERRVAALEAKA